MVLTDSSSSKDEAFWSGWNSPSYWQTKNSRSIAKYKTIIHPLIAETATAMLKASTASRPIVREVCAGAGRIAKMVLDHIQKNLLYLLLERNQDAINTGQSLLEHADRAHYIQTDVVREKDFFVNPEKTATLLPDSVDLCIGSGALTHYVLANKNEALAVLAKIHRYLKKEGYLLLAGATGSWLGSTDFTSSGFTVINRFAPGKIPFYILQKK